MMQGGIYNLIDQEVCVICIELKSNIDYVYMREHDLVDEWVCKDCSLEQEEKWEKQ